MVSKMLYIHLLIVAISISAHKVAGAENVTQIKEALMDLNGCMIRSTFSFVYQEAFPPVNVDQLKQTCLRQTNAFKCLKEKSKNTPALIKRGVLAYGQARQKHHKSICSDLNSDSSKKFLEAVACISGKGLRSYKENDAVLINRLIEVRDKNFNDSSIELKYLCCSLAEYRKVMLDLIEPDCTQHRTVLETLFYSVISNDLNLICEEEEKLLQKICPKLVPLKVIKTMDSATTDSSAGLGLYLFATLGIPE